MPKPDMLLKSVFSMFMEIGAAVEEAPCRELEFDAAAYVACEFHPDEDDIRLFLSDSAGAPFGDFDKISRALEADHATLVFAMNAGMYHRDRSPVGLYVENFEEGARLSTRDGPGNFHMKPNGVFWIWAEDGFRGAHVAETESYSRTSHDVVKYATQSGPMLVIDGALHPRFLPDSESRKRRNGVGVRQDGAVIFAISDEPVTFHQFARLFRDELATPNALYLDGTISRIYAPSLERNEPGLTMGPIVGVVVGGD